MSDGLPVWVLGGGGISGIAWQTGLLAGLADEGIAVSADAIIIGTSAGAVVGANIASGTSAAELYDRQVAGVTQKPSAALGFGAVLALVSAHLGAGSPQRAAQRIGRLALSADACDPADYRSSIEARLVAHDWTAADLRLTAVDVASGELRVFTRADRVSLVDAVGASCAVPMSVSPVEIDGNHYMDGGMRSTLNLDLAPGDGPVFALAPSTAALGPWARISRQRRSLDAGRRVEVVYRDSASRRAQGSAVMVPSIVPALAAAGREQGRREAQRLAL